MTKGVIIAPARHEGSYIEETILAIVQQTLRPVLGRGGSQVRTTRAARSSIRQGSLAILVRREKVGRIKPESGTSEEARSIC